MRGARGGDCQRNCPIEYDRALNLLCRQSALFEHFGVCESAGLKIPEREVKKAVKALERARENLIIEKKNLGFEDGCEFIKTPLYSTEGFQLVNQRLTGKTENVVKALQSWRTVEKVTPENHFRFEQATLALTHYYVQTGQYRMPGRFKVAARYFIARCILRMRTRKIEKKEEGVA
ncbi:MAG: hypothetical protein IKO41_00145 [Lachnospiraceae bacterium]|nr:hypothetical protein [Lachnospiraceae bacterium]